MSTVNDSAGVRVARPSSPVLWLDLLPQEVCRRISAHVTHAVQSDHALHLAESSSHQVLPVLSSLACTLDLRVSLTKNRCDRWVNIFAQHIVDIRLSNACDFSASPHILQLLAQNSLRCATIPDDPVVLQGITASTSIRDLAISLSGHASWDVLFATLRELELQKLTLTCISHTGPFQHSQAFGDPHCCGLAEFCPNLESLAIYGKPQLASSHVCSLPWDVLGSPLSVAELLVNCDPPDHLLPALRTIQSVQLEAGSTAHLLALDIGSALTRVCPWATLQASHLSALGGCPRLSDLRCRIAEGADRALPDLLTVLPLLRTLHIQWDEPDVPQHREGRKEGGFGSYASATPHALVRALAKAPKLSELYLTEVRLCAADLSAILQSIGERLERFQTSIADQEELPLDRLEILLITTIRHNRALRRFLISEAPGFGLEEVCRGEPHETEQSYRLFALVRRLRMHAPYLDTSHFDRITSWLAPIEHDVLLSDRSFLVM